MLYTKKKLREIKDYDDIIQDIIDCKVVDKSQDIENAIRNTFKKLGVSFDEKVLYDFMISLQDIVLQCADGLCYDDEYYDRGFDECGSSYYDSDCFSKKLKILYVNKKAFEGDRGYKQVDCHSSKLRESLDLGYDKGIKLIANSKSVNYILDFEPNYVRQSGLEILENKYGLLVTKTAERCLYSKDEKYHIRNYGDVKKISDDVLLILENGYSTDKELTLYIVK